ncbi:MAG: GTPase ObgE [Patescibacteria group bacterium]|nr:GTPase ObgE [Patescibacteria group bacterium]MCL5262020.1 GTPase ObgE [Patescibacteria group bacterium]
MLIDDVTIRVSGGDGGRGGMYFSNIKMQLGPTGGSGGKGGSVFLEGVSDLNSLTVFRYKKEFRAQDGDNGRQRCSDGRGGDDVVLKVPVGTVITDLDTGETKEILRTGQKLLAASGGNGGKGNFLFRSSKNTSPTQFQEGRPGETKRLRLELKLIADVGLVGLPNAGKSSLLNELTNASAKVANYPFTTLEPNLGVYYELILADIPGLIAGASAGKGLGIKFLRHIERTRIVFHLVSAESTTPVKDYRTVRSELKKYNPLLLKKPEYLFLSKSDLIKEKDLKKKLDALKKINPKTITVSIHDWDSLEKVKKILNKIKAAK